MPTKTAILTIILAILLSSGLTFYFISRNYSKEVTSLKNEISSLKSQSEQPEESIYQCSKNALFDSKNTTSISDPKKVVEKFYDWLGSRVITVNANLDSTSLKVQKGATDKEIVNYIMVSGCYDQGFYFGEYGNKWGNFLDQVAKRFTASSLTEWSEQEQTVFYCLNQNEKENIIEGASPSIETITDPSIIENVAKLTVTLKWEGDTGIKLRKNLDFEMKKFTDEQIDNADHSTWLIKQISCK